MPVTMTCASVPSSRFACYSRTLRSLSLLPDILYASIYCPHDSRSTCLLIVKRHCLFLDTHSQSLSPFAPPILSPSSFFNHNGLPSYSFRLLSVRYRYVECASFLSPPCLTVIRSKPLPLQSRWPYHWLRQRHCPRCKQLVSRQDVLNANPSIRSSAGLPRSSVAAVRLKPERSNEI